jgi:methylenetetrahydrofolate reductase (NADPH)
LAPRVSRAELVVLHEAIVALARAASVEMTWRDTAELDACRPLLPTGTDMYASYLPGQSLRQTLTTCVAIREAGFEPVPHIAVRQFADVEALEELATDLFAQAQVQRVLLIAGDIEKPFGPFSSTLDALRSNALTERGIRRIVVAGHPEGHPTVSRDELWKAEMGKVLFAEQHGLELAFLTQFLFVASPFLEWARGLRADGIKSRLIVGLAGPAKLSTLVKYAIRCGVGPSIRALTANPGSFAKLVGERGPEKVVRAVAAAGVAGEIDNFGIHLFSFGGLVRTCKWMHAVADGRFVLDEDGGFRVQAG